MNFLKIKLIYHGLHLKVKTVKNNTKHESIGTLFYKFWRTVFSFKIYMPFRIQTEHLFYIGTNNQKLVLEKIYGLLNKNFLIYYHGNDVKTNKSKAKKYPFWIAYLLGLISYPFSKNLRKLFEIRLSALNSNISCNYEISLLLGFYYANYLILMLNKPKYIWLSNDHVHNNVSFIYAAKKLKIKTLYIQHASVSNLFPPLNFDYAFLDGEIAYKIYQDIGIAGTKVFLTGNPKLDGYINKFPDIIKVSKILICVNGVDNMPYFENLIDKILEVGIEIKLRKHPYLNYTFNNEAKTQLSREISFLDALEDISLVIAGDSNVHLEATICNIPCMYLATSTIFDYYGFVKNGLVIWAGHSVSECIEKISKLKPIPNIYRQAKPYFYSIDTEFENKSASKILTIIKYAD